MMIFVCQVDAVVAILPLRRDSYCFLALLESPTKLPYFGQIQVTNDRGRHALLMPCESSSGGAAEVSLLGEVNDLSRSNAMERAGRVVLAGYLITVGLG